MARWVIRTLQGLCLAVIIVIIFDMAESGLMPPPVPLDEEGHTEPYSDSPLGY
jgi:hypothetical protein